METAIKNVTFGDVEQMNVTELRKCLQTLLLEKKGWKCLAAMIEEKEEEIVQLKEAVVNYEQGMELAEYRATILQEQLEKLRGAYVDNKGASDVKLGRIGLYLPNTMKQVIEMITAENSKLHKALASCSKLHDQEELVMKYQELQRQIQVLEQKVSSYEEFIHDIRLGNARSKETVQTLLLEKLSLSEHVDRLRTYTKSLREKNTSLLTQLAEVISERDNSIKNVVPNVLSQEGIKETSSLPSSKSTIVTDIQEGPHKNASTLVIPLDVSGTNQGQTLGNEQYFIKECQDLRVKCEKVEKEKQQLEARVKLVTEEKEEQEKSYTEIVNEMNARVAEANNQVLSYEYMCKVQSNELQETKDKLERLEREWRQSRAQIKVLEKTVGELNERLSNRASCSRELGLSRIRTNLPKEPYAEAQWSAFSQSREILMADSSVSPTGGLGPPNPLNSASARDDDIESLMTLCPNCKVSYPSNLFEDHLKECNL